MNDTHNAAIGAQGRTQRTTEHPHETSNDDVITFTEMVMPNEVTIIMGNTESQRTLTLRCGDIQIDGDASPAHHDSITNPGRHISFDLANSTIIREVILDRISGETIITEGETLEGKQQREQRERQAERPTGRYSQNPRRGAPDYFWFDHRRRR